MATIDLYTRLSIARDGSDSIERQESDLRDEAERLGHTVRRAWSDGASGYKKNVKRPEFEAAIEALTTGAVDELWVWKLDRLSRQGAGKVGAILDTLDDVGGRIIFLKDGLDSTTHRPMIIWASEQARTESKNTSLRVSAKNEFSVSQGFPVAGRRRYGYLGASEAVGGRGNVEAHPDEAPDVQAIFADFLSGASIRSLAIARGWRNGRIRDVLGNAAYAGWIPRGDQLYPAHESVARLITQEQYDSAKAKLANNPAPKGGGVVKHLASGIAKCGVCGAPMTFRNGYLCLADLSHPWIKEEFLDKKLRESVVETLIDPEFSTVTDPSTSSMKEVRAEYDDLETQVKDILTALDDKNPVKMSDLLPYIRPLKARQAVLERRMEQLLQESVQERLLEEITASIKRHLGTVPTGPFPSPMHPGVIVRWEYNKLSLDQKRELIRGLFDVIVNPGRGTDRVSVTRKVAPRPVE